MENCMKTFVINLDTALDRMGFMAGQLRELGIVFERFPAICGRDMTLREWWKWMAPLRQWWRGHVLYRNEVACTASHLSIFKRMIDESIPRACIMEDDMTLFPSCSNILKAWEKYDFDGGGDECFC